MDGWWLISNTVDDCLQRQIAKKIFKLKIETCPVKAGHYMAFKHHISFATYMAANFGCNQFRITPDIVPKLLLQPSEVAVLLDSNLSRRPFLGQVIIELDLLLSIQNMLFCSYAIFLLRAWDQWQIERLSKEMGAALVSNNFLPIPLKISFYMKKTDL